LAVNLPASHRRQALVPGIRYVPGSQNTVGMDDGTAVGRCVDVGVPVGARVGEGAVLFSKFQMNKLLN